MIQFFENIVFKPLIDENFDDSFYPGVLMSTLQCTLLWIMRYIGPPKVIFKRNMQTLLLQIRSDQLISTY